ncbi:hypothetical protein DL771_004573 [Monosporascus sp. 5C6A]|nr:hypothetical protein DL771_004573 [Monosporascus sp. 5C6A]
MAESTRDPPPTARKIWRNQNEACGEGLVEIADEDDPEVRHHLAQHAEEGYRLAANSVRKATIRNSE